MTMPSIEYFKEEKIKECECNMKEDFVFLSYSHQDFGIVSKIFINIFYEGLNTWIDRANLPVDGNTWKKSAGEALESDKCKMLVFFRSENSIESKEVFGEIKAFREKQGKENIIVVDLSDIKNWQEFENKYDVFDLIDHDCNAIRYKFECENEYSLIAKKIIEKAKEKNIKVNTKLQKMIANVYNKSFVIELNKDQRSCFEVFGLMLEKVKNNPREKHVLVVSGKPGSGKSCLAMKMFSHCMQDEDLDAYYFTSNRSIKNSYTNMLLNEKKLYKKKSPEYKKADAIWNKAKENIKTTSKDPKLKDTGKIRVAIADEAQNIKLHTEGKRLLFEDIAGIANLSVFFYDDSQKSSVDCFFKFEDKKYVYSKDSTKINIWRSVQNYENVVFKYKELTTQQVRSQGANPYINWVDALLGNDKDAIRPEWIVRGDVDFELEVLDFQDMRNKISKNIDDDNIAVLLGYNEKGIKKALGDDIDIKFTLKDDDDFITRKDRRENLIGHIKMIIGLEADYTGIIIGPEVTYENDQVLFKPENVIDEMSITFYDGENVNKQDLLEAKQEVLRNIYRILLTRASKGCYIYCVDDNMQEYLKDQVSKFNNFNNIDNF